MRRFILLAWLLMSPMAWAHVTFDHADPKVGSKVAQSPTEVTIWFSDDVDPSLCSIEVLDASGNRVDKKDVHVDVKDKTAVIVSVPALAAGTYKVVWRAACVDKHKVKGSFKFEVKK
jgi:methionine-rich copper-binding protein CopC